MQQSKRYYGRKGHRKVPETSLTLSAKKVSQRKYHPLGEMTEFNATLKDAGVFLPIIFSLNLPVWLLKK